MDKFIELLKTNPKKAILVLLTLLFFSIGSFFLSGCAYRFHVDKADNMTHSIDIRR